MGTPIKYYYDLLSQPSRTMFILLNLNKVPTEFHPVALFKKAHLTPAFKQINRFQKVPCIVHDDFKLAESVAILRYLDGKNLIQDKWYPKDIYARARTDEYLAWHHNNTRLTCVLYFWEKWFYPILTGKTSKPAKLIEVKANMEKTLDSIENIWLGDNKYLTGNEINAADIFAACEILQTRVAGYNPNQGRPKLEAWLATVRNDANPYFDEAHKGIENLARFSGVIQAQMKIVNFFRNMFRRKK